MSHISYYVFKVNSYVYSMLSILYCANNAYYTIDSELM
jgi:hypothetical protein